MKKSIYITAFILCWIFFLHQAKAQDFYQTKNGNMLITAVSADTAFKVTTKDLLILLNYENANITIKMDKSTFKTGIDSLDKKIAQLKYDIIEFNGKLDIEYINTTGHPPLDFVVEGIISTNQNSISGDGHLEHISNRGTYSCMLTLKFNVKINDLGLNFQGLNLKEDIQIEIVQTVLNKSEDN